MFANARLNRIIASRHWTNPYMFPKFASIIVTLDLLPVNYAFENDWYIHHPKYRGWWCTLRYNMISKYSFLVLLIFEQVYLTPIWNPNVHAVTVFVTGPSIRVQILNENVCIPIVLIILRKRYASNYSPSSYSRTDLDVVTYLGEVKLC